ncbi:MAG: GntR family transcriptional regulator [Lentisphaeria bacterium]|nr:GntR family transcriptional regulator [Lentisphaeria bacterium]
MPHPPKVNKLCAELKVFIKKHCPAGTKLPSERRMSADMGISSRTLGIVMRKLAEENIVCRNRQGTFVCGDETKEITDSEKTITILLPSSDFSFSGDSISQHVCSEIISGVRKAAIKHNCQVITIPVSDHNTQSDINPEQFKNLTSRSRIIFSSVWFKTLFPIFREKKCRIACLNSGTVSHEEDLPENDCFLVGYGCCLKNFFDTVIKHFSGKGRKNVLIIGKVDNMLKNQSAQLFADALKKYNMHGKLHELPENISITQFINALRRDWFNGTFDTLVMLADRYIFSDMKSDFFKAVELDKNTPILITDIDFFNQEQLKQKAEIIYIPIYDYAFQAAEFLISNEHKSIQFEAAHVIKKATDKYI